MRILEIEEQLDWYFNVFPTCVGLKALDPGALFVPVASACDYTDHQLTAVNRSLPIREALDKVTPKEKKILTLVFTSQCWHDEQFYLYMTHYGKLAGLVKVFRIKGESISDKRARAEVLSNRALRAFARAYKP